MATLALWSCTRFGFDPDTVGMHDGPRDRDLATADAIGTGDTHGMIDTGGAADAVVPGDRGTNGGDGKGDSSDVCSCGPGETCNTAGVCQVCAGWVGAGWAFRKSVLIIKSQIDTDLTDFPVYIDMSDLGSDLHANMQSDGSDIRVTLADGTTEVPREVVHTDTTSETGQLHFRASLSSSAHTSFYVYYGNPGASEPAADAPYGSQNVWTNSYAGVWHLEQDPGPGGVDDIGDSTANNNSGTAHSSMTSADRVSAQLGWGLELDGSDDSVLVEHDASIEFAVSQSFSISCWVYYQSPTNNTAIVEKWTGTGGYSYAVRPNSGKVYFERYDGSNTPIATSDQDVSSGWHHVVATFTASSRTMALYVDGALDASRNDFTSNSTQNTAPLGIGGRAGGSNFRGLIDEVRVSNTDRAPAWIKAEHANQATPLLFYDVGLQEGC